MAEPRRTCREGTYALGALTLFALWLFVGLPLLYGPRQIPLEQQIHSGEVAHATTTEPDHPLLEQFYWGSQIILAGVAGLAAIAAFLQLGTFKLFELLKIIEAPKIRKARRIVLREISKRPDDWWANADPNVRDRWERAASDVCAAYDILGKLIKFDPLSRVTRRSYGSFYRRNWARSIVLAHETLRPFIKYRRAYHPEYSETFSELAKAAGAYVGTTGARLTQD